MNLKNGRHIDLRAKDSWGERAFVFWVEDCFDPPIMLVRGDSFEDAYAWFVCDPWTERHLVVEDHFEDYIDGWDHRFVYGVGETNPATREQLGEAYADCKTFAIEFNDNGVLIDTDAVQGVELCTFAREQAA